MMTNTVWVKINKLKLACEQVNYDENEDHEIEITLHGIYFTNKEQAKLMLKELVKLL